MTIDIGIELGGTKTVVAGSADGTELVRRTRIETTDPTRTIAAINRVIAELADDGEIGSVGIGTFGPVDLRPGAGGFAAIVSTPKPGWSGVRLLDRIAIPSSASVAVDTDVNAALLGEVRHGAGRGSAVAYLTVGTGVGGALWVDGTVVHGANHPEIGHLPVPRHPDDDHPGSCPYHGDCLEGMASGPALSQRFGERLEDLGSEDRDAATQLAAHYVGRGVFALTAVVPVDTVVIGGGVANLGGFHDAVATAARHAANGYPPVPFASGGPTVVPPGLGDDAGVIGAIELGRLASEGHPLSG